MEIWKQLDKYGTIFTIDQNALNLVKRTQRKKYILKFPNSFKQFCRIVNKVKYWLMILFGKILKLLLDFLTLLIFK